MKIKTNFTILLWIGLCLFPYYAMSQSVPYFEQGDSGLFTKHINFTSTPDSAPLFQKGRLVFYSDSMRQEFSSAHFLLSQDSDKYGITHYQWQQTIHNIPVENAILWQHVKKQRLLHQYGLWVRDTSLFSDLSTTISAAGAITLATQAVGASLYKWQDAAAENALKLATKKLNATYDPTPELVFYSSEGVIRPASLRLAYKLEISASKPFSCQVLFIDAKTGTLPGNRSLVAAGDVTATAQTAYSGSQTITTNQVTSTDYILSETSRGFGIHIYNASTSITFPTDFHNSTTTWTSFSPANDQYATDAMWGHEKTYDFYLTNFGRNSIDGSGAILNGYVHADLSVFGIPNNMNAFWDGGEMIYGDGGISGGVSRRATPLIAQNFRC